MYNNKRTATPSLANQFVSWGLPPTMVVAENPRIDLKDAFAKRIEDDVVAAGCAPKTVRHCQYIGRLATDFFGEDKEMTTLSSDDVLRYHDHLASWLRPDTVRKALTDLKCVLRWCAMRGYRVLHPDFIKLPKHEKRTVKYLTEEEVFDFIDVVRQPRLNLTEQGRLRNVAVCELLYSSGVRVSELVALNRKDIKKRQFNVVGKSKMARPCYVSPRAERALNEYLATRKDKNPALFLSTEEEKRLTDQSVRNIFKRACLMSDFEGVHPHTFRHSFATNMIDHGVDISFVGKFLGHESLDVTKLYLHFTNQGLKKIHEAVMG